MKKLSSKTLSLGTALAIGLVTHAHASVVEVTPSNMNGWSFVTTDENNLPTTANGNTAQMVTGPATPPLGSGSAQLATSATGGNGSGAARISTAAFDGQALSSLTTLSFSTYATANNGQQVPFMEIAISKDGSGSAASEDSLFFEPPYQSTVTGNPTLPNQGAPVTILNPHPSVLNQWQTWNAAAGGWWDNDGHFNPGTGVGSLAAFEALFPNATIMNNIANGGVGNEGVTLLVGEDSALNNGYVDNVTVNSTTFDFEPDSLTAVPEPTTFVAGALLLLPFGVSALRMLRKKQTV